MENLFGMFATNVDFNLFVPCRVKSFWDASGCAIALVVKVYFGIRLQNDVPLGKNCWGNRNKMRFHQLTSDDVFFRLEKTLVLRNEASSRDDSDAKV